MKVLTLAILLCVFDITAAPKRRLEGTPETGASHVAVDLTPGQKITQRMAVDLTIEELEALLPEKELARLKETTAKYGGLEILSDASVEYDETNKYIVIDKLRWVIYNIKNQSEVLRDFYHKLLHMFGNTDIIASDRIEQHATKLFNQLHPGAKITFSMKEDGKQLGTIARVADQNGQTFTYYVKTHASGLKDFDRVAPQLFNVLELLVYKILEKTGMGCPVYFFARNERDLYIATLEAGPDFTTYENAQKQWPKTKEECKILIAQNQDMQTIGYELMKLSFLERILGVTDLLENSDNFGFVTINGQKRVKVLDFIVTKLRPRMPAYFVVTYYENWFLRGCHCCLKESFVSASYALIEADTISWLRQLLEDFGQLKDMIAQARDEILAMLPSLVRDAETITLMQEDLKIVAEIYMYNFDSLHSVFNQHVAANVVNPSNA